MEKERFMRLQENAKKRTGIPEQKSLRSCFSFTKEQRISAGMGSIHPSLAAEGRGKLVNAESFSAIASSIEGETRGTDFQPASPFRSRSRAAPGAGCCSFGYFLVPERIVLSRQDCLRPRLCPDTRRH